MRQQLKTINDTTTGAETTQRLPSNEPLISDADMAEFEAELAAFKSLEEKAAFPRTGSEANRATSPSGSGSPVRVSAQTRAHVCAPASVRGWRPTHPRSRARDRLRVPPGTRRMLQVKPIANANDSRGSLCASAKRSDVALAVDTVPMFTDMQIASPSSSGTPVRVCAHAAVRMNVCVRACDSPTRGRVCA